MEVLAFSSSYKQQRIYASHQIEQLQKIQQQKFKTEQFLNNVNLQIKKQVVNYFAQKKPITELYSLYFSNVYIFQMEYNNWSQFVLHILFIFMKLSENQKELVELCTYKGCVKGIQENVFVPYNLAVQPFETSRQFYENLGKTHEIWQKLIHQAGRDKKLILETLSQSRKVDPWVNFLLQIFQSSEKSPRSNTGQNKLLYMRSDYFVDTTGVAKIIEYNLICVGLGHEFNRFYQSKLMLEQQNSSRYFENNIFYRFTQYICEHFQARKLKGIFVFLISDSEIITIIEQKSIQIQLMQKGIKCKRILLKNFIEKTVLNENNDLYYEGTLISFVYFRTGYLLADYQKLGDLQKCLQMRIKLAKSNAICIPDVAMELVNLKRIQVELSKPEVMRRYLSEDEAQIIEKSIIQTFDLENLTQQKFQEVIKRVEKEKDSWILKPNMQGGENNIFGQKVYEKLKDMPKQDRSKYIIQKWIQAELFDNRIIQRGNKVIATRCNYEISRYGIFSIVNGNVKNQVIGNGVRSRAEGELEGMVILGNDGLVSWKQKTAS